MRAASTSSHQQPQQTNLVSLDSWSQPSNDNSTWDAFSNQPDASAQPAAQLGPLPSAGPQPSPLSPLSPQRQAAAARAQAFIKTQTSNVQSMQVHCLFAMVKWAIICMAIKYSQERPHDYQHLVVLYAPHMNAACCIHHELERGKKSEPCQILW